MDNFKILLHPDPFLRKKTIPVISYDSELKEWADKMFNTMYSNHGIGLASTQVGDQRKAFVMDVPENYTQEEDERRRSSSLEEEDDSNNFDDSASDAENRETEAHSNKIVFVNPEIIKEEEECTYEEGCLSIPGVRHCVKRNRMVTVKYFDLDGIEHVRKFENLEAVCIQHELDHLNGVLFFDRLSVIKKSIVEKKYLKQLKKA